ncbi:MAG: ATP-binding cassette domain-containing protein [Bacteroidia bacterium]|nr:ATP-binding cassette domain-containing protein [Bacteroidia bacterium]
MSPLKRFFKLLNQDKKDIIYLYLYAICNGIINLSLPIGIQAIMGLVLAGRLSTSWGILTLIVVMGVAVAGLFQIMQLYIVEILQRRLFARAAFDFAFRIPKLNIKELGNSYLPELVNRFFDTISIQKSLSKILIDFSTSILQIIFGLILLSLYHPIFIAFGLVLLLLLFLVIYLTYKPALKTSIEESNHKYEMAFWLTELARSLPTFKLNTNSDLNLQRTDKIVNKYINSRKQHFKVLLSQYSGIIGLKTLVTAGLLIVGAILLISNSITIGQFVAAEIVIILILNSSEKLIMSMEAIYDTLTAMDKIGSVTDINIEKDIETEITLDPNDKIGITAKDLEILSIRNDTTINQHVNFNVIPGKHVCITGETGSGKSSILKILSTNIDNYTGSVLFNDIPLKSLDINKIRKDISCIDDNQEIFYGTIYENITLGRKDIPFKNVVDVTKKVGLAKLVDNLPDSYQHLILNSEHVFSGTDRVRLFLARTMISNPKLVLTEDIFSSLKPENSTLLLDTLFEYCKDKTLIIVSNNEQVIRRCDSVINLTE